MELPPIVYILFLISIPGVRMQLGFDENDYDDELRVSNSQPQNSDNYQSISFPTQAKFIDPMKLQNDQQSSILPPKNDLISRQSKNPSNNLRLQRYPKKIQLSGEDPVEVFRQAKSCQWMTLDEFKNVSLDTIETIIKDAHGNACYVLTIRAYLRKGDTHYFPVKKFKFYHYDQASYSNPSDGANLRPLTNCSLTSTSEGGTTGPLRAISPFEEEIAISVDCGYLLLKLVSQGFYLKLENISFYENPEIPETRFSTQSDKFGKGFSRSIPEMSPDHLVFSPKNTTSQNNPLLVTPLVSRFVCQNRVILDGFNEVKLVADRFELLRLLYTPGLLPSSQYSDKNRKSSDFWYPDKKSETRNTRDIRLTNNGPVPVTRCPSPRSSLTALESFMAVRTNRATIGEMLTIASAAYKLKPSAILGNFFDYYWLNHILIIYLIRYTLVKSLMTYSSPSLRK